MLRFRKLKIFTIPVHYYNISHTFQSRATSTVTIKPLVIDPFGDVAIDPMEEEEMALLGLASGQPAEPPRTTVESTRSTVSFTVL